MFIQLKNIKLIYGAELSGESLGAEVDYKVIMNDLTPLTILDRDNNLIVLPADTLDGKMTIMNGSEGNVNNWELWNFNKYIFQKIMKSL